VQLVRLYLIIKKKKANFCFFSFFSIYITNRNQ
jgi:hypothetical protein